MTWEMHTTWEFSITGLNTPSLSQVYTMVMYSTNVDPHLPVEQPYTQVLTQISFEGFAKALEFSKNFIKKIINTLQMLSVYLKGHTSWYIIDFQSAYSLLFPRKQSTYHIISLKDNINLVLFQFRREELMQVATLCIVCQECYLRGGVPVHLCLVLLHLGLLVICHCTHTTISLSPELINVWRIICTAYCLKLE